MEKLTENDKALILFELRNSVLEYERRYFQLNRDTDYQRDYHTDWYARVIHCLNSLFEVLQVIKKIHYETYELTYSNLDYSIKTRLKTA